MGGGMEDGRWSSISIKGTEFFFFNTVVTDYRIRYRNSLLVMANMLQYFSW